MSERMLNEALPSQHLKPGHEELMNIILYTQYRGSGSPSGPTGQLGWLRASLEGQKQGDDSGDRW